MPDHVTQRTRRVMALASDIALRHGLVAISDVVILIAIIEEGRGIAATLLKALGVDSRPLYRHLPKLQVELRVGDLARALPVSSECQRILQTAEGVAAEYGSQQVATEHLLIAIIRTAHTLTAEFLTERGVTEMAIRETAARFG